MAIKLSGAVANREPSVNAVDHGFYTAEMLLTMAKQGVGYANFHGFSKKGECGLFDNYQSGSLNAAGQAFALTAVLAGGQYWPTSVIGSPQSAWPRNRNCAGGGCFVGGGSLPYGNYRLELLP